MGGGRRKGKSNQIKSNLIKSNQIKSNQIKSNQIKPNQTKPRRCAFSTDELISGVPSGAKTLFDNFREGVKISGERPCLGKRPIVDGVAGPFVFQTYNEVSLSLSLSLSLTIFIVNYDLMIAFIYVFCCRFMKGS